MYPTSILVVVGLLLLGVLLTFNTTSRRRLWKHPGFPLIVLVSFGFLYFIYGFIREESFQSGTKPASCTLSNMGGKLIIPFVDSVPPTLPTGLTLTSSSGAVTTIVPGTTYTLNMTPTFKSTYNRLAYVLVGAGGNGGSGVNVGGGGGSGYLVRSSNTADIMGTIAKRTINAIIYNIVIESTYGDTGYSNTSATDPRIIDLSSLTSINFSIGSQNAGTGNNGNQTTLGTKTANGGKSPENSGAAINAGQGYNTGGKGYLGAPSYTQGTTGSASGGTTTSSTTGAGTGGGTSTSSYGAGGAGGTQLSLVPAVGGTALTTGGIGKNSTGTDRSGLSFTGAGGSGGSTTVVSSAGSGGSGYVILKFYKSPDPLPLEPVVLYFTSSTPPTLPSGFSWQTAPASNTIVPGTTYTITIPNTYTKLAYILVGGGGGGAYYYGNPGSGGGGSGYIVKNYVSSDLTAINISRTVENYTWGPSSLPQTANMTDVNTRGSSLLAPITPVSPISLTIGSGGLAGVNSVSANAGGRGASTTLNIGSTSIATAFGGGGGLNASCSARFGGDGHNGGGGPCGLSTCSTGGLGGLGDKATNGGNGENGFTGCMGLGDTGPVGSGGGVGAGIGNAAGSSANMRSGGGGGGGPGVTIVSGQVGGNGAGPSNHASDAYDWSGAGGGGGGRGGGGVTFPSRGGHGYAILIFYT